jgi:hypothetical protein
MDGRNFDDLTRKLAKGASRRSFLKGLLGGAGAVAATAVVKQGVEADHCNPSTTQITCPAGTEGAPGQGGPDGVCCNGPGNCCSRNCVGFGQAHAGICSPANGATTTTQAPGGTTTTQAPGGTTTTQAPGGTTTTQAPGGTTPAPDGTTPAPTGGVSEVPSTGVGDGASGSDMLGITLAGGAAALVAAKVLRNKPAADETLDS